MFVVAKAKLALDIKKTSKIYCASSVKQHAPVCHASAVCRYISSADGPPKRQIPKFILNIRKKKPTHDFFSSCGMWFFSVNPFIIFS